MCLIKALKQKETTVSDAAFPYDAWTLPKAGTTRKVKIAGRMYVHGYPDWMVDEKGHGHNKNDLFESKQEAVAAGCQLFAKQQADINKKQAALLKRLDKLEAQAGKAD